MSVQAPVGGPAAGYEEEFRNGRVLVVEDTEASRRLIGAYLAAAGIRQVAFACDGVEALEKAPEFDPDLVILDIMMPRMDGFEVCRRLRADARFRRLPILVQTALGAPEERTSVFRAGATDLVTKPLHGPELIARVRVHLENRLMVRSLEQFRERLQAELDLAREMQAGLLPNAATVERLSAEHGVLLESHFAPSSELGGDYWGAKDLGDGRLAIYMVDFAGHGVTAALNTFRLHTLIRQLAEDGSSPSTYLGAINDRLVDLVAIDQYATFLYGVVDTRADAFTYASAGAPSPVIGAGGAAALHDASGLPVGIARGFPYEDRTVPFPPGSFLFLYSDALVETEDADGNCLTPEDVARLAAEAAGTPSPIAHILARFHTGREVASDDLTLVWLGRQT